MLLKILRLIGGVRQPVANAASLDANPSPLTASVSAVIDEFRPYILADGGDIELVRIDDAKGVVHVRLKGACVGCPSSFMTLQMGLERQLRERIPQIQSVISA